MTLQDQVISLESAKRLKELGVEQRSLFSWIEPMNEEPRVIPNNIIIPNWETNLAYEGIVNDWHCAFTCSELGELLPIHTECWKQIYNSDNDIEWRCNCEQFKKLTWDEKEVEARAKLLIYLLEQGLIKI